MDNHSPETWLLATISLPFSSLLVEDRPQLFNRHKASPPGFVRQLKGRYKVGSNCSAILYFSMAEGISETPQVKKAPESKVIDLTAYRQKAGQERKDGSLNPGTSVSRCWR
jgi:hypothetical protein